MIDKLIASNQELLIDAYCGVGFFAKALLHKFERVLGIDWDNFAIAAAQENAVEKESYIAGDVDRELSRVQISEREKTTLILDPPAAGLTTTTRRAIIDLAPKRLVYVSCNPPTLARDLKELQERFTIESITPLDMFPQTAEIEVVASASCR